MVDRSRKALAGVKVVECATFVAGPFCAKLLADFGAQVIKIEQPGKGDESRRWGPFPGDKPHPEKSGLFLYLNTNKFGITLDLKTTTGQGIFKKLIKLADILVEDNPPGEMNRLGLSYQSLREINTGLTMTSITPFGQTGPYADYKSYYLNTYQSGMLGHITPIGSTHPEREPLKIGGLVGEYACGLSAAVATLSALYFQRLSSQGQHIDISKQEALISLGRVDASYYANSGINLPRAIRLTGKGGIMRCRDGYICVRVPEDSQWAGLVQLMGYPKWATDERYRTAASRMQHIGEVMPLIEKWASQHTKEEICQRAQELGCIITPVTTAGDVANSQQSKARGLFSEAEHSEAGRFKYPIGPFHFSKTTVGIERPAPSLGQNNEEIYIDKLGYERRELVEMTEAGII